MSESNQPDEDNSSTKPIEKYSLSQALLAPLDAILKSQIHAARSFLNMLFQLAYPHIRVDEEGNPIDGEDKEKSKKDEENKYEPYYMEFNHEVSIDGKTQEQKLRIPTIALLPVAPLAVETAEFKLSMAVKSVESHIQMQRSESRSLSEESQESEYGPSRRPWFLVDKPISVQGEFAPPAGNQREQSKMIDITIKVSRIPMPSGLDKVLTALSQTGRVTQKEPTT